MFRAVTGRGVVLLPGLGKNYVKVLTPIRLVRPDQTVIFTTIRGIGFNAYCEIQLGEDIRKEDVPIGTEVWVDE